jgi:hypothetical protein
MGGLGAAAGALATAALITTMPIASADDTPNVGYAGYAGDVALPALTSGGDDFSNQLEIFTGNTQYLFTTTWDGSGAPVTMESSAMLPTGDTEYGWADAGTGQLTIGTDTLDAIFQGQFLEAGNQFEVVTPFLELSGTGF